MVNAIFVSFKIIALKQNVIMVNILMDRPVKIALIYFLIVITVICMSVLIALLIIVLTARNVNALITLPIIKVIAY